ncbi:hypothetical protein PG993_000749 [Apiospora rasikravindrae]|uniref:Uncharacterized protein n=1 Tax=Apiospora rasikravindrae TaxID=990691 RepID=A0ABR1U9Z8_9PEZI
MSQQQFTSTGRGGAGNIGDASNSPKIQPKDLETPTLKHTVVTTGRGGSGNMRTNKDPAETRALQDVEPVVERQKNDGIAHVGRGGAANVVKLGSPEIPEVKEAKKAEGEGVKRTKSPDTNLAAKGKEWLFGKKA